mmetsp:Transcript_16127/g.27270  ORF Transcript_16127/g.27270 Transcript_16127/m.27270 type:complete len:166 (+) Transcript_16127:859-1356(+)
MRGISEADVQHYFQDFGKIDSIDIPRDHITLKPKGYVIVDFSRPQEAKDAVAHLDGFEIDGKKIHVQIYTDYVQRQLNTLESKQCTESINQDSGASFIHTTQARALLMQKLMAGRDMGELDREKQLQLLGLDQLPDDDGHAIRMRNFQPKEGRREEGQKEQPPSK